MRELKVIGLDPTGQNVILQDPATDDRFSVPADDSLRAAARGDLSRLGQIEIEMTSHMRPREIQAKVRAGASVEEIAELAGLPASRVERFAHPVLLERSNAAHLGTKAHPVRADGPTVLTLGEVIAAAFGARGLDPEAGQWDAWRPDGGEWVIQLTWLAGRSENAAHWRLHRDAHGGTVTPMDDAANELIDPNFTRSLRPIAQLVPGVSPVDQVLVTSTADPVLTPQSGPIIETVADLDHSGIPGTRPASAQHAEAAQHTKAAEHTRAAEPTAGATPDTAWEINADDDPAAGLDDVHADSPRESERMTKKSRKNKPTMPSWEDVLLGVRSNTNG